MDFSVDMEPPEFIGNVTMTTISGILANETSSRISGSLRNDTWDTSGSFQKTIHYLNQIGIPLVVLFGTLGNTLSLVVFVRTHLRYQSSSVYLAFLNVVDTGFLLSLFLTWFSWLEIRLFHRQVWCQLVIYFSFVFAFLSVWTVVAFTVERFIVVYRPLQRQQWCTRRRAKIVVLSLTTFALVFYAFPLWCAEVRYHKSGSKCVFKQQYYIFLMIMTFLDTVITMVIPSLIILFLNGGITYKIFYFFGGHLHLSSDTTGVGESHSSSSSDHQQASLPLKWSRKIPQTCASVNKLDAIKPVLHDAQTVDQQNLVDTIRPAADDFVEGRQHGSIRATSRTTRHSGRSFMDQRAQQHRRVRQLRTTRTLLVVSSVFLLLNLPSHSFRIYHVVIGLVHTRHTATDRQTYMWQQLLQLVYYTNFAINFVLYIACSRSFRCAFQRLHRRLVGSIRNRYKEVRRRVQA